MSVLSAVKYEGIQQFEPISREHPGLVDVLQVGSNEPTEHFIVSWSWQMICKRSSKGSTAPMKTGRQPKPSGKKHMRLIPSTTLQHYTPKTLRNLLQSVGGTQLPQEQRRCLPVDQCLRLGSELTSALEYLHRHKLVHRDIKPSNIIFVNGSPKLADVGLVTAAK